MIAVESVIGVPLSISTGTLPAGLKATTPSDRGAAAMCSKGWPSSSSIQSTRSARLVRVPMTV